MHFAAFSVVGLIAGVMILIEMNSLGSLARPAAGPAAAPSFASREITDRDGFGPACIISGGPAEAWISLDDLNDGSVYQMNQADPEMPLEHIWWDPATGPSRILVSADADTAVRPYTVSGTPENAFVWFTRGLRAVSPTDYTVGLYRVDLNSGEETLVVAEVGGFETQPLLVSVSPGGLLVSSSDSTGSWFELYDIEGSPVAWPANPHPMSDYTMKTVYGSLSEDGRYLASIEAEDGAAWRVVVRNSTSGDEIWSRRLPQQIWRVVHADTSGAGFSFLVETAVGETACISVPRPTQADGD